MHDLRGMNVPELETSNGGKIAGAVLVALVIGAAATYTFSVGMWNTQTPQAVAFKYPPPVRAFAPVTPVVPSPVVTMPAVQAPPLTPSTLAVKPARMARVHIPKHEARVAVPPTDTVPAQAAPQESGPAPVVTTPPLTPPMTPVTPSQPDIQP